MDHSRTPIRKSVGEILVDVKKSREIVVQRPSMEVAKFEEQLNKIVRVLDTCRRADIWNGVFATLQPA